MVMPMAWQTATPMAMATTDLLSWARCCKSYIYTHFMAANAKHTCSEGYRQGRVPFPRS